MQKTGEISPGDDLMFALNKVKEFLRERCDYRSESALVGAFADFRRIMEKYI